MNICKKEEMFKAVFTLKLLLMQVASTSLNHTILFSTGKYLLLEKPDGFFS